MINFGTDNELMIFSGNGNILSALDIIPGRKQDPTPLKRGEMQADNVNAELNTEPSMTFGDFRDTWTSVLQETQDFIREKTQDEGATLQTVASFDFPNELLQSDEAKRFGCEPDFNAYSMSVNKMPPGAAFGNLRTAGGHIHIGYGDPEDHEFLFDDFGKVMMILGMDMFVGLPITCLDRNEDSQRRRKLYGGASAHRPKAYGVEYRALSNFWCRHPEVAELTFNLTQAAAEFVGKARYRRTGNVTCDVRKLVDKIGAKNIQTAINNSDAVLAEQLFNDHIAGLLPSDLGDDFNRIFATAKSNGYQDRVVTNNW